MLFTLVALTSLATPPPDAENQVERGRLLIRDLREEEALAILEPLLDSHALPKTLRARALVYAGIAQLNLGDERKARARFQLALEDDPGAVLPDWVSRKVRSIFDELLRARMKAQPPLSLRNPPLPPEALTDQTPRRFRSAPAVGMWAGAAVLAAVSAVSFVRWDALHRSALNDPNVDSAYAANQAAKAWWYVGEGGAVATLALAGAGAWAWNAAPRPGGAVVGVTGTF